MKFSKNPKLLGYLITASLSAVMFLPNPALAADVIYTPNLVRPEYHNGITRPILLAEYGCKDAQFSTKTVTLPDGTEVEKDYVSLDSGELLVAAPETVRSGDGRYLVCPEGQAMRALEYTAPEPPRQLQGPEYYLAMALSYLLWFVAWLGLWLLGLASDILYPLLTAGKFITNDIVRSGWVITQGVANLGFVIALLAIAALTVLRIDVGGGIKRLLPRLLIAALLINFSLIIGGVLLDGSRLLMALSANLLNQNGSEPYNLGANIINSSALLQNVFCNSTKSCWDTGIRIQNNSAGNAIYSSWDGVLAIAQATIFVALITGALVVLIVMLFIRHVALLILLIVSPFAYLAAAVPGAGKFATQWWDQFIKYIIYGPVVMLGLSLIAYLDPGASATGIKFLGSKTDGLLNFVSLGVVVAFLVAIISAGKYLSIAGAATAVGFAKGLPGKAARNPNRNKTRREGR